MAGLIRLGTDLLHQSLLHGMSGVQLVPPRFRSAEHWAELVNHGLLDGAIISSFCLEQQLQSGQSPRWDGLTAMPLGQLALQLVATTTEAKQVLLPRRGALPLLHQALEWNGLGVALQPEACQEPAAWLKRARDRKLAMPICADLLGPGWLEANALVPLAAQLTWTPKTEPVLMRAFLPARIGQEKPHETQTPQPRADHPQAAHRGTTA